MSEEPPFWYAKPGIAAWLLSPFAAIYSRVTMRRMTGKPAHVSACPVLCIGNLVAGGAGKTPTALALGGEALRMGLRPGFLTRGHGGSLSGPVVVETDVHTARQVGDEPLLLADLAPTVVAHDRAAGAKVLEAQDIDFIVMDDGFQNPGLRKDYALVVVDSTRGIGNGFAIPAGPLRANVTAQMTMADGVLIVGSAEEGMRVVRHAARAGKPVLSADFVPRDPARLAGKHALAFAGIANPKKFYDMLEKSGVYIAQNSDFEDHHPFSASDCKELLRDSYDRDLVLMTTTKDAARLRGGGAEQKQLLEAAHIVEVDLVFDNPKSASFIIRRTIERAERFRLRQT